MIIREILAEPDRTIGRFDFFNDARDTISWLKSLRTDEADQIAERLNVEYRKWLAGA